jgi:hypothetical protein
MYAGFSAGEMATANSPCLILRVGAARGRGRPPPAPYSPPNFVAPLHSTALLKSAKAWIHECQRKRLGQWLSDRDDIQYNVGNTAQRVTVIVDNRSAATVTEAPQSQIDNAAAGMNERNSTMATGIITTYDIQAQTEDASWTAASMTSHNVQVRATPTVMRRAIASHTTAACQYASYTTMRGARV